ncbi:MAG: type IV pilin protein [Herbaspirillum sp.]
MKYQNAVRGFSLIELMIVVAIVAILAAIAFPSYTNYVVKTRRVAATACLSEYANYMERYYTTNLRYDTSSATPTVANVLPNLDCASAEQTGKYYAYDFGTPTISAYTVTAAPKSTEAKCGTLTLDQAGTRTKSGTDTLDHCW